MRARFCPSLAANAPALPVQQACRERCRGRVRAQGRGCQCSAALLLHQQCWALGFLFFFFPTQVYKLVRSD